MQGRDGDSLLDGFSTEIVNLFSVLDTNGLKGSEVLKQFFQQARGVSRSHISGYLKVDAY